MTRPCFYAMAAKCGISMSDARYETLGTISDIFSLMFGEKKKDKQTDQHEQIGGIVEM